MTDAETYHQQGFVLLPAVFEGDALVTLKAAALLGKTINSPWVGPWQDGPATLRVGWNLQRAYPVWATAIQDPRLMALVHELLGSEVQVEDTTVLLKPPGIGAPFPWHQDSAYYRHDGWRYVIAQVYLDDVTVDNGSLQLVPKSHTRGLLPHVHLPRTKLHLSAETIAQFPDPVLLPAKAGDVVLFHHDCVHGSLPNRSAHPRLAVRITYIGKVA